MWLPTHLLAMATAMARYVIAHRHLVRKLSTGSNVIAQQGDLLIKKQMRNHLKVYARRRTTPNAAVHRLGAALTIGTISLLNEKDDQKLIQNTALKATAAYAAGTLADILEPACNPNHRQFFHSLGFAGILAYGLYKAYKWQPTKKNHKVLRDALMIIGGAYLVHLVMDSSTPKGLPII